MSSDRTMILARVSPAGEHLADAGAARRTLADLDEHGWTSRSVYSRAVEDDEQRVREFLGVIAHQGQRYLNVGWSRPAGNPRWTRSFGWLSGHVSTGGIDHRDGGAPELGGFVTATRARPLAVESQPLPDVQRVYITRVSTKEMTCWIRDEAAWVRDWLPVHDTAEGWAW